MKKLVAKIAYDGSAFSGFARQRNKHISSVCERIEFALRSMGINDEILGAGRTDKGVHASGQIISFCVNGAMEIDKIKFLLNHKLYPHIFIKNLKQVDFSFHPRFDAKRRGYRYIFDNKFHNPFISKYISNENYGDKERMQKALNLFLGKHCFCYFKKQGSPTKSDIREIFVARFYEHKIFSQKYNVIYIEADGFLRAQVRLMIACVLAYCRGEITQEDIILQLNGKKQCINLPVSPNGLYLVRVIY
ncbi:tRNA pseudouridine(38-40) synthase TruA [Helicobacter sp. 11S03491-1]|uniref:tRNA pseudouridine(38-40) synthase TruA n=1 Tax=Helicobacter sp. 11S03491-1 TaxID=1476196 RepID=UPI000BA5B847|nr:tRNA pseudouridine(38-40) synthase TruA [Helicobacter sp. 11S03491-1]PAF41818.1 tRNA pseudouridine(38-40) synthase TruA [Helicobacter sp. 11S03491-1]